MADEPQLHWRIAGQIAGPQGAAASSIAIGRELPENEIKHVDYAIRMLIRLAQTEAYARAAQLLQAYGTQFAELTGRDRPPPAALLTPPARSAAAVIVALRRIPGSNISVATDFVKDEQTLEELRGHIEVLEQTEPWRLVIALDQYIGDPRRNLSFTDERLLLRPEPLAAIAAAADADADTIPHAVGELLSGAMNVALKMVSRQLLACDQPIRDSSLLVRHLAAEVLLGHPVLVGFPPGEEPTDSLTLRNCPKTLQAGWSRWWRRRYQSRAQASWMRPR